MTSGNWGRSEFCYDTSLKMTWELYVIDLESLWLQLHGQRHSFACTAQFEEKAEAVNCVTFDSWRRTAISDVTAKLGVFPLVSELTPLTSCRPDRSVKPSEVSSGLWCRLFTCDKWMTSSLAFRTKQKLLALLLYCCVVSLSVCNSWFTHRQTWNEVSALICFSLAEVWWQSSFFEMNKWMKEEQCISICFT